jgi:hypothetical protein
LEFKNNFGTFMHKDSNLVLSLSTLERHFRERSFIPVLDNPLVSVDNGWGFSITYIMDAMSYFSIVMLGFVVYILFRRSQHLNATLMTLVQLLQKADASDLDSLLNVKSDILIILWILMSIAVILFVVLLLWKSCVKVVQNIIVDTNDEHRTLQDLSTSVYLGLYGQDRQRAMKLATIPVTLSDLQEGIVEPITDIQLSWCRSQCILTVNWTPLTGLFRELNSFNRLPTQTSVTWFDYFFIKRLIKRGFLLKIILKQNEKTMIVCQSIIPPKVTDSPLTAIRSLHVASNRPEPTNV